MKSICYNWCLLFFVSMYSQTCFSDHLSTKTIFFCFPWKWFLIETCITGTCLQKPLFVFSLGGCYRQAWLYLDVHVARVIRFIFKMLQNLYAFILVEKWKGFAIYCCLLFIWGVARKLQLITTQLSCNAPLVEREREREGGGGGVKARSSYLNLIVKTFILTKS